MILKISNLYKSYLPKGEVAISGCGTSLVEKSADNEFVKSSFAVENISFELEKSEIISILGENGSGKSTLLKIIAGLLEPDSGNVYYKKEAVFGPVKKLIAGHEKIKLIHQNYNLFPNISLAENIAYVLRFHTKDYIEKRLQELLELCHLEEIKDKLPRNASGGEQQRTAIAAALAADAEVLLFDEPFANLDIFNRTELKGHIKRIAKKSKIAVVFVTHDAQDALSISDKLFIMKDGEIIRTGKPSEIYQNPQTPYVAQLTGLCNILKIKDLNEIINSISLIQDSNNKYIFIRPDDLVLKENLSEGNFIVKEIFYYGDYWLVKLYSTHSKKYLFAKSKHAIEVGTLVSVSFLKNDS